MSAKHNSSAARYSVPNKTRFLTAGICIALAAITWLVFGQTIRYPFINFDDQQYVVEIPQVTSGLTNAGLKWAFTHVHGGNWHPLTSISHMLDCQIYGLKAGGHHFTNVLLHAATVILLFLVMRQMTASTWPSAFVAAVFAVHPLRAESVAWIAERKDVLSGLFFVMTLGAYVRYVRHPNAMHYVLTSLLFALGLMCKPMLVTLPLVLLLLDFWPLGRLRVSDLRGPILEKIPLFVLSAASCVATIVAQQQAVISEEAIPLSARIGNALVSYVAYIWQMLWPTRLAVFYPHASASLPLWQIFGAGALLLVITVAVFVSRKNYPFLFTGWFWYLIMLIPVIGLVQVGLQGHADRYTYLPQIGLVLALTWLVADVLSRWELPQQVRAAGAGAIVLVLALLGRTQTGYWRDSESLWTHTIAVTSDNDVAHAYLADLLLRQNKVAAAMSHAQTAVQIRPGNVDARNNLGLALLYLGDANGAVINWRRCLEMNPHHQNAECNLAWVLATCPEASVRDGTRAVALVQDALQRAGMKNAMVLRTLAAAFAESGRFAEAIATAQEGLQLAGSQGNSALADDLRLNVINYQQNLPLRDPSLANVQP